MKQSPLRPASPTLARRRLLGFGRLAVTQSAAGEAAGLGLILAVALMLRLAGIGQDTDISDEGIRGLQLRLMAAGYRPVSEIYASQGPLSLSLFYPLYRAFGGEIVAARLAVVAYSAVCLLAVYAFARFAAGPPAALAAATVLALSPSFVEHSRLAFVEVPSLAPALVGLALLARWREAPRTPLLIGSAVLLAVGALAKPMAGMVGLAAAVLLVFNVCRAGRWRGLALYAAAGLATIAVVVAATSPDAIFEQLVAYRLAAREVRGWDPAANWGVIARELGREGVGMLLLAGIGALAALSARRAHGLALGAWLIGGLTVVLAYSPLWPKHLVYLVVPLGLLAGIGVAEAAPTLEALARGRPPRLLGVGALVAVVVYLVSLPGIADHDRRLIARDAGADADRYADDLRVVAAATGPDDFIVMDDAYLAATTGRLVPPYLADLSWNRLRARALAPERAIAETERFDAAVLVVQDDHLGQLPRYLAWADRNYVLVKSYVQRRPNRFRRVYVRPDADLAAIRTALAPGIQTTFRAEIGPVALLGTTLERRDLKTGSRFALTFHWESLAHTPPEHHLVIRLRDAAGRAEHESTWRIGDGAQELPTWPLGRWQLQTVRVLLDNDLRPGEYRLTLGLDRPNSGLALVQRADGIPISPDGRELDLGPVTVR